MGCGVTLRFLIASSIFLFTRSITNGERSFAYVADPLGNPLSRPSKLPSKVGSPSYLARPDRYEFYTFDETGELIKRLMTLEEIQEIIATGDGDDGHLLTVAQTDLTKPSPTFNIQPPSNVKVHTIVNNVQNVLKAEMEAQKINPPKPSMFDTPDVSSSWSMILPAIFGNTGGSITPDTLISSHIEPETDVISVGIEKESNDNLLPQRETTIPLIDNEENTNETLITELDPVTNYEILSEDKNPDFPVSEIKNITNEFLNSEIKTTKINQIPTTTEAIVRTTEKIKEQTPSSTTTKSKPTSTTQIASTTQRITTKINTTPTTTVKFEKIMSTTSTPTQYTRISSPPKNNTIKQKIQTTTEKILKTTTISQNASSTTTTNPKKTVATTTTTTKPVTNKVEVTDKISTSTASNKQDVTTIKEKIISTTAQNNKILITTEMPFINIHEIINQIAVDLKSTNNTPVIAMQKSTTLPPVVKTTAAATTTTTTTTTSTTAKTTKSTTTTTKKPVEIKKENSTKSPSTTTTTIKSTIGTTTRTTTKIPEPTTKYTTTTEKRIDYVEKPTFIKIIPIFKNNSVTESIPEIKELVKNMLDKNITKESSESLELQDDDYLENTMPTITDNYIDVTKPNFVELSDSITDLISQIVDDPRPTVLPSNTENKSTTKKENIVIGTSPQTSTEKFETWTEVDSAVQESIRTTFKTTSTTAGTKKSSTAKPIRSTTELLIPVSVSMPSEPQKYTTVDELVPTTYRPSTTFINNAEIIPKNVTQSSPKLNETNEKIENIKSAMLISSSLTKDKTPPVKIEAKTPTNRVESVSEKIKTKPEATTDINVTHDDELMEMLSQVSQIFQISSKIESKSDDLIEDHVFNDKKETSYKTADKLEQRKEEIVPRIKAEIAEKTVINKPIIETTSTKQEVKILPEATSVLPKIEPISTTIKPKETQKVKDLKNVTNVEASTTVKIPLNKTSDNPVTESLIKKNVTNVIKEAVSSKSQSTTESIIKDISTQKATIKNEIVSTTQSPSDSTTQKKEKTTKKNNVTISSTTEPMSVDKNNTTTVGSSVSFISTTLPSTPQNKAADSTAAYISSKIYEMMLKNEQDKINSEKWKLVSTVASHSNVDSQSSVQIATTTPLKSSSYTKTKLPDKIDIALKVSQPQTTIANIDLDIKPHGQGLERTTLGLGEDVLQFSQLCNELAFRYWKSAASSTGVDSKRSLVVSPFAVTSVLAMMFLGARGATSGEMNDILKLDDMVTFNPHIVFKNVTESIEVSKKSGVATSAFVRELYSDRSKGRLLGFYKDRVQQFYSGHVEEINFKLVSDVVRRRTNLLVKRQTWGKIPEYIKGNNMHMRPPLSVFAANIFQTDCSSASTDGRDGEMYFVVSPSIRQRRLVPVPAVLYKSGFLAGYVPELDATVAALGGVDQIVSTIFVMPGQQGSTAQGDHIIDLQDRIIETAMKEDNWSKLLRSLIPRQGLELQIPRFSHRSIENGSMILQKIGLKDLFSPDKADLRGLNGIANDLYLSDMMLMNTFTTCGEGFVGEQHHVEVYPGEPNKSQRRLWRTQRPVIQEIFEPPALSDFWEEPRDYQRAFHDPLHDNSYLSMPLHLRPRQARLPESIPEPPRLKFDKPFMFFVRHNPTGLILYIGRYNPRLLP